MAIVLGFLQQQKQRKSHNEKQKRRGEREEEGERGKLGVSAFNNLAIPAGLWPFLYFQMWRFANVQD